jgi:hypothetical protein
VTQSVSGKERLERALERLGRVFGPDQVAALVEYEDAMIECRDGTPGADAAPASEWMSVPETAELLRCPLQHVYDLRSERRLTPYREGGRAVNARAEVVALVEKPRR